MRILVIFTLLLFSWVAFATELPDLGDPNLQYLSAKEREHIQDETKKELQKNIPFFQDLLSQYYIQQLGRSLVSRADVPADLKFDFFIIADDAINAFAAPGGYIGLNTGTILASENESELAAVLAHEIAHISQHHLWRAYANAKQMRIPMILGGLAAIAMTAADPTLGEGALMAGMAGMVQAQLSFTRENEQEADRIGMGIIARSGFDPAGMPSFFQRLLEQERLHGLDTPEFLRTHPLSQSRIADATNRAAGLKHTSHSSLEYSLIRARIRAFSQNEHGESLTYFKHQAPSVATEYGIAMANFQNSYFSVAETKLKNLCAKFPDNIILISSLAEVEMAEKKFPLAIEHLSQLNLNYPDDVPVTVQYAQALIANKDLRKATNLLDKALLQKPKNMLLLQLLARAHFQAGQEAQANWTLSKIYENLSQNDRAIVVLQRGLKSRGLTPSLTEKMQARLKKLKTEFSRS